MIEYRDGKPLQIHRSRADCLKGHETFLAYCRTLMENGHHYDAQLFIYKDDESMQKGIWDVKVKSIGDAAQCVVDETRTPKIRKLNEKQLKFIGYNVDVKAADAFK